MFRYYLIYGFFFPGHTRTEADLEEVDKQQSYLERNAPYIPSLSQRSIHTEIHLGTAETNHRFYKLSHETARAELVQRRNGVHGLGTDRPEE